MVVVISARKHEKHENRKRRKLIVILFGDDRAFMINLAVYAQAYMENSKILNIRLYRQRVVDDCRWVAAAPRCMAVRCTGPLASLDNRACCCLNTDALCLLAVRLR